MINVTAQPNLCLRTLLLYLLCLTVLLMASHQAHAQQPIDYSALPASELERMAEQGDVEAVLSLVKRSHTVQQRRDWLTKAAQLDHVESQYALYMLLVRTNDVEQQHEGYAWLQRAALNGFSTAQRYLGEFYLTGGAKEFGIAKDAAKAELWLGKAASQGNIRSHEILADALAYGTHSMALNFEKSRTHYEWLIEQVEENPELFKSPTEKAQQYNNGLKKVIQYEVDLVYDTVEKRRTNGLKLLNRSNVREATHAFALQLLIKLGKEGDQHTQYELARIYALGRFKVPANPKQAYYWYQQAAAQSHIEAMQDLMNAYGTGWYGAPKDLLKARQLAQQLYEYQRQGQHGLVADPRLIKQRKKEVEYYDRIVENAGGTFVAQDQLEQRAHKGEVAAQYQLALQLLSFDVFERGREAYRWMKRAADGKHADANFQLYRFYDDHGYSLQNDGGLPEAKKKRLAFYYLQRAVELRHMEAIYVLANANMDGRYGLTIDYHQAKMLYQQVVSAKKEELEGLKTASHIIRMSHGSIANADRMIKLMKAREEEYAAATPLEKKIIDVKRKYGKKHADAYNAICKNVPMCTTQYIQTKNKKIKKHYQSLRDAEIKKVRREFGKTN